MFDNVLFLGIVVFLAEVTVLTLGTVRTMVTVLGESRAAFCLGCVEMTLWIFGTSAVMLKVGDEPFLGVCYALGFACGNVVGIMAERSWPWATSCCASSARGAGRRLPRPYATPDLASPPWQARGPWGR